jgi:hypothetical protein
MEGERGREVREAEGADGWGPRGREKERARAEKKRCRQVGPIEEREGEEARGLALTGGTAYQAPRVRGRGRACRAGSNGPTWAEFAFLFSREFLIAFPFIFSRVFHSNSNQVSNPIQIKHVQQFKEYLELNMI